MSTVPSLTLDGDVEDTRRDRNICQEDRGRHSASLCCHWRRVVSEYVILKYFFSYIMPFEMFDLAAAVDFSGSYRGQWSPYTRISMAEISWTAVLFPKLQKSRSRLFFSIWS